MRVKVIVGFECRKCGNLISELYKHSSDYCPNCGVRLFDIANREAYEENVRKVLLQKEYRLFGLTYTLQKIQ